MDLSDEIQIKSQTLFHVSHFRFYFVKDLRQEGAWLHPHLPTSVTVCQLTVAFNFVKELYER
jgi:hypothetical protein